MRLNSTERSIKIDRQTLLAALRANLAIHKTEFAEAVVDYKNKLAIDLHAARSSLLNGSVAWDKVSVTFNRPISHEMDYVEAIEILEYEVRDEVEIDGQSFKAYVKNVWPWTTTFSTTNASLKLGGSLGGR